MAKTKEKKSAKKVADSVRARRSPEAKRKSNLSREYIVESDGEEPKQGSDSGHSSGSESDLEKRKNTKTPNPQRVSETEPASPPVPDVTSDEDDEDDSDEDEADSGVKASTNGTQEKAATNGKKVDLSDDSSDDSSSEEDSEEETVANANGEAAEVEAGSNAKTSESKKRKRSEVEPEAPVAKAVPSKPTVYELPPGYTAIDMNRADTTSLTSLFSPSALGSKQIWHITAPAGVPLSEIQSFTLSTIRQTAISHKGSDYSFVEENRPHSAETDHLSKKRVVIPSASGSNYVVVDAPVTKVLHLQQMVKLPHLSKTQANPTTGSNAAAEVNKPAVRRIRPQPKGLRMRYKPPGFGTGAPGMIGSDSEDESDEDQDGGVDVEMRDAEPAAGFRLPKSSATGADETTTSKKSKTKDKDKTAKEHPKTNGTLEPSSSSAMDIDEVPPSTVDSKDEETPVSKEEKARLKAEKKKRKEEKRARKEANATTSS